jgi:iron(III) transport system ATP-binding protein
LLDEPLSALDAKVRIHLRHEIKALQQRLGVTTVMVTHDQEEALAMADRIVVMNQGVIEQIGTPTEIYREPSSLFVADFIGAMNQFKGKAGSKNTATVGDVTFASQEHDLQQDTPAVIAIRPEDIVPHSDGAGSQGATELGSTENTFVALVEEMEFLGSFWRVSLSNASLGDASMVIDMSINAVRQMDVAIGNSIKVEFPSNRLWVFPPGADTG